MTDLPPTRWEGPTDVGRGYGRHFADLIASGADVEGEARLADVLVQRHARILDAGSGMGRIGAALRRAGHDAYGVDLDAGLIDQSRAAYPELPVAQARLEQLDGEPRGGRIRGELLGRIDARPRRRADQGEPEQDAALRCQ